MELAVGNIVRIVGDDLWLNGKQGEIVEIDHRKEIPYSVKFGKSCRHLFDYPRPENLIVDFTATELQKEDRWDLKILADDLYGTMWHSAASLSKPFDPSTECMHEDHTASAPKATARILVNCWGTVYELDVCEEHKFLHGLCGETLPIRRPAAVA
jgi:hypothetical protein